jgi:hypothetical protein
MLGPGGQGGSHRYHVTLDRLGRRATQAIGTARATKVLYKTRSSPTR